MRRTLAYLLTGLGLRCIGWACRLDPRRAFQMVMPPMRFRCNVCGFTSNDPSRFFEHLDRHPEQTLNSQMEATDASA